MATQCFTPIKGKRIRVTQLDECGRITPTSQSIVTDGFITVNLSGEIEDGNEILVRNANGAICINEKQSDSFKRLTVEIQFCDVNPSLMAVLTNAQEYADYAGDVAGFTVAEGEMTGKFALELWTGLAGQACGEGGEASGYMLLPLVNAGTMGDLEIGAENAITFSLSNATTRGGNTWGTGPYLVMNDSTGPSPVAAYLPTPLDSDDHLLIVQTDLAPPPAACEPGVVPPVPVPPVGP